MAPSSDMRDLRRSVEELSALQRRAADITARPSAEWRQDLVAVRRDLASATARLFTQLEALRGTAPPGAGLSKSIRAFGEVRQTLALHQATWPAVAVDPDLPAFQASVRELRAAYDTMRAGLVELEQAQAHLQE